MAIESSTSYCPKKFPISSVSLIMTVVFGVLANHPSAVVIAVLVIGPSRAYAALVVNQVIWPESVDRPGPASRCFCFCFLFMLMILKMHLMRLLCRKRKRMWRKLLLLRLLSILPLLMLPILFLFLL